MDTDNVTIDEEDDFDFINSTSIQPNSRKNLSYQLNSGFVFF